MLKKILMLSACLVFPTLLKADFVRGEHYFEERNYSAAFNEFLPEAVAGDPRSQYYVGFLYYNGYGVSQNLQKAFEFLTSAADKNHSSAQTLLAFMYENGQGVAEDKKKAVSLYTLAANQGDPSAIFNLGLAYYLGNGVARNTQKAIELLSQIPTDKTRNFVGHYLGEFYLNSDETDKNEKAKMYFSQSANFGYVESFYFLAELFEQEGDLKKALEYYTYAASKQYAPAQFVLGKMYINGTGVNRDLIQGLAWMEIALNQQYEPAQEDFNEVSRKITLSQREKAREEFNRIQRDVIEKLESPIVIQKRIEEEQRQENQYNAPISYDSRRGGRRR